MILFFALAACGTREQREPLIEWEDEKAVRVVVPYYLTKDTPEDVLSDQLTVHLSGEGNPAIAGALQIDSRRCFYTPLVPFTRGLTYEIRLRGEVIASFEVPLVNASSAPEVVAVFPSADTVPENLLKFYFQFSKPMREGEALKHIVLMKNGRDTMKNVFLDLQPELWDGEAKQLTLWLDPGRIKRDLQPNQKLGNPLEKGVNYQLIVDDRWEDRQGGKPTGNWSKDIFVGERDNVSPSIGKWTVLEPQAGTRKPLRVQFNEPLDYALASEAIFITDMDNNAVPGVVSLEGKESVLLFTPSQPWSKGIYYLQSEARLEDLAGNNLRRLFEQEISRAEVSPQKQYSKLFSVE